MKWKHRRTFVLIVAVVVCMMPLSGVRSWSEQPSGSDATKAHPLPKIDDVVSQLRFYAERLDESLAKAEAYDESKQTRVEKDAATVAALAALLDRHSEDHSAKPAAKTMLAAATAMAASYRDYAQSAAANERLKHALAGSGKPSDAPDNAPSAEASPHSAAISPMLMKQIRFIDNRLKRAARDRAGSEKLRSEVAGHAATIAALAAPLASDAAHHAKDASKQRLWIDESEAMAAAAAMLNLAAHDPNARLADAVRTLDATCARCHADFR